MWPSGVSVLGRNFRCPSLVPKTPCLSGSTLPPQPHLTLLSPSLTSSLSSSKGLFSSLPVVLCPCCSMGLKFFSLTLDLANTFWLIRPHSAQMLLPRGKL